MNRVSDAMRRAGQHEDAQPAADADDMLFVSGEDAAEDPVDFVAPRSETDSIHTAGPLVRRDRAIPIEMVRGDSGDDVQVFDVMRMLYRRRWLMAVVIAASVATAVIYNRLATPIYDARARLLLEPNSPEVVPFKPLTEDQGRVDYFVTQLEVLRSSRGLARRTLEQLHLLSTDPTRQSGQISQLLGGLTVAPVRSEMGESRVINLTYRSDNPELAAGLANGLAETYVAQNLDARRQGSRDAAEWLNQRLAELRRELNTREAALQQYREQKDSVSLGDQQNIVVQKLAQLNVAVTTARTERLEKQAVYQQLVAIQESGAPLDTFSPILSNPFLQGLKADVAGLRREREPLLERLGDIHPDMIKVNNAIATAERRLNTEMAKVVEGIQNDYKAAQEKERKLTSELEDQKREVLSLNQKSIGFNALQRDVASTQQMLETVRQRLKETELSGELQSNNVRILDIAEVPRNPILPRTQLNLLVALLGGGFVAACLALGVESLNPHLDKPGNIAGALGLPLLGIAPRIAGLKNRPATVEALPPAFQEALRGIRTRIFLSPIASISKTMAVTSTNPGEGKTMVASNLSVSMAMAGRRVLLVDADLRHPQLHRIFNIPIGPGLSDVMAGTAKPTEALLETRVPGLFVLAAGADLANPTDLLDSERLTHLIQGLGEVFDVVVLDCPPVMAVADASIIANAATSVLFVVGSGTTNRAAAQVAIDRLAAVQAEVVGVVLNKAKVDPRSERVYAHYVAGRIA